MSAGAQPTVVANGAAAPGGSEALPTDDECAFGREYCRRYRKRRLQGFDDGLHIPGTENPADNMTKQEHLPAFQCMRSRMNIR